MSQKQEIADIEEIIQQREDENQEDIYEDDAVFDPTIEYDAEKPLLTRDSKPIFTRGNISMLFGLPGCRKSFLSTAIAGAMLSDEWLGFRNTHEGSKVLYIDTEQANCYVEKIYNRVCQIAKLQPKQRHECFLMLALRKFKKDVRLEKMKKFIDIFQPDLCIIDGITDTIEDTNNMGESKEITEWLMHISETMNNHIVVVMHSNASSPKRPRGHIGSELWRKVETNFLLEANNDMTNVEFLKTKNVSLSNFSFSVNAEGLPIIQENFNKVNTAIEILKGHTEPIQSKQFVKELADRCKVTEGTIKNELADIVKEAKGSIKVKDLGKGKSTFYSFSG